MIRKKRINKLYLGKCEDILTVFPSNSIDTIITDPPAGIAFMNKKWDSDKGGRDKWIEWFTGIMTECYRIIKPGGIALVWAIPRTSHWTATAIENAGFRINDIIMHIFGSGFPKSLNISKQIDKMKGAEREIIGKMKAPATPQKGTFNCSFDESKTVITAPATLEAQQWDGWGTGLKPAAEHWIFAMKPCEEPALDIFKAVIHTLNKKGFNDISWKEKPVKHVRKQKTLNSSIKIKLPRTEEIFVENAKKSEMGNQEKNIIKVSLKSKEKYTQKIQKKLENTEENMTKNKEKKRLKSMGGNVSVAENLNTNFSRLTTSIMTEKNIEKKLGDILYETSKREGTQKTISESFVSTAISLVKYTEIALTINFEGNEYIIERLSNNIFVWPKSLPKYRKARSLTYAQNALKYGVAGINIDGGRIEGIKEGDPARFMKTKGLSSKIVYAQDKWTQEKSKPVLVDTSKGRFPANIIFDEEAAKVLDEQSGVLKSGDNCIRQQEGYFGEHGGLGKKGDIQTTYGDSGGASRFFYCAKASKSERNKNCEHLCWLDSKRITKELWKTLNAENETNKNNKDFKKHNIATSNIHPTVKSISLMEYLCTLTKTPFNDIVLDPFMGTGTTGIACKNTSRGFIGIEDDPDSYEIAKCRINYKDKKLKFL